MMFLSSPVLLSLGENLFSSFFGDILGYIQTLFSFFLNFIGTMFTAVAFLQGSVTVLLAIVPMMPAIIGASITIVLAIYVVRFLLLR